MSEWLVCLTFDHDNAASMISRKLTSPTMISRGDFGIAPSARMWSAVGSGCWRWGVV